MEFLLKNCLKVDYTTSTFISSPPVRQVSPFLTDEDSGPGMEMDPTSPKPKREKLGDDSRSPSVKRHIADLELSPSPKSFKRHRSFDVSRENKPFPIRSITAPDNINNETSCLIAEDNAILEECTISNSLPTIQGKHRDLNTISADTMREILSGDYGNTVSHVTVIDCRYPYEYQSGHILNAVNIFSKDGIDEFLRENQPTSAKHVLIFHCEFSSKRGPKLCRFLRSRDREMNKDNYPKLNFPEIYLLEGGYKQFYESHKCLCFPEAYKPMLDKQNSADLRHFRVKSKSWAAGDKPRYERTGLQRLKLSFN